MSVISTIAQANNENNHKKAAIDLYKGLEDANRVIIELRQVNYNLRKRYKALLKQSIEITNELIAVRTKLNNSLDKQTFWIKEYEKLRNKKFAHKWISMSINFGVSNDKLRTEASVRISPFKALKSFNFFLTGGYEYIYKHKGDFYWLVGIGYSL